MKDEELAPDPVLRSIVLTGRGRGFSTGGDLRMMRDAVSRFGAAGDTDGATLPWQWIRYQFGAMVRLIGRTDKAFVAAINGPAAGVSRWRSSPSPCASPPAALRRASRRSIAATSGAHESVAWRAC